MRFTDHYNLRIMDADDYYNIDDFNKNTESVDNLLYNLNYKVDNLQPGGGSTAVYKEVTLLANDWDLEEKTQTVQVEGITTNSIIILGMPVGIPDTMVVAIIGARINPTVVTNGSITFKCYASTPNSSDVTLALTVFDKQG